uniref:Uncharacterized protein n=1 Tax=Rhabditophanes sp. KR3021 TaxID=114890 RepID=A0AC35UBZ3_9BILA
MDKHPINENVIVSRQYWNPQCRKKTKSVGVEFLNLTDKQRSAYDQMKIEFYNCVNYKCFVMLYKSIRKIGDYVMYDTIQYHPEDKSTPSDNCNELRYNLERQCKMLAPYWEPATLSDSDYVESD